MAILSMFQIKEIVAIYKCGKRYPSKTKFVDHNLKRIITYSGHKIDKDLKGYNYKYLNNEHYSLICTPKSICHHRLKIRCSLRIYSCE